MNFLFNKNAWLTGSKGFIGSAVEKSLKKNYNIFPICRGDKIQNNTLIKKNKKIYYKSNNNYLLHLATYYNPKPKNIQEKIKILEDNLLFGLKTLNSFNTKFFKKILITQSSFEYLSPKDMGLYATSKNLFSQEIHEYFRERIIKVYLYDTFGIGDKRNKIIDIWIKNLLLDKDIRVYSEKAKINLSERNFVANIISNFSKFKPGSYEIRSNFDIMLGDLALFLKEITHSKSKIIIENKDFKKIPKKNKNLADVIDKKYTFKNFKKDISEVIEYYERFMNFK